MVIYLIDMHDYYCRYLSIINVIKIGNNMLLLYSSVVQLNIFNRDTNNINYIQCSNIYYNIDIL